MDEKLLNIVWLATYLSIVIELILWPVPSIASTYQLGKKKKYLATIWSVFSLVIIYFTFFFPLISTWTGSDFYFIWPYKSVLPSIVGIVFIVIGRCITIKSAIEIRKLNGSKDSQQYFTTSGLYKFSRNPGLIGMYLTLVGVWITHPALLMIPGIAFYFGYMHFKVLMEERFLLNSFGKTYKEYCNQINRYL